MQPRTTEGPPVQHAASSKRDNRGTDFFGLIRPRRAAVSGCQAALDTTIVAPPPRSTHLTFSTSLKLPSARTHARARARLVEVAPPSRARETRCLRNGGPREPASRSRAAPNPADACPAARCPDPGCVRQLPTWDEERYRAALPHGRSCGVRQFARFAMPAPLQSTDRALLTRFCHAHRLRALGSVRPRRPNAGAARESSGGAKAQGQREGLTGEGARARRKAAAAAPAIATVYLPQARGSAPTSSGFTFGTSTCAHARACVFL